MGINSVLTAFASNLRRLTRVAPPMLVVVVVLCWAVSIGYALSGYLAASRGTKTDTIGFDMGPTWDSTCFLSGVSGNLNHGAQQGFGCGLQGEESIARVNDKFPSTGHYWLVAHGGACGNQVNQQVWDNNPVQAQATCFFTTSNVKEAEWQPGPPVKITGLNAPNNKVRQCFLSGLWGVAGAWDSSSRFAWVRKVTSTDSSHPTTGWYIEANLPQAIDDSHPRVEARCVDFPQGTTVTTGSASVSAVTKTHTLTSGSAVKACALTKVKGAFNVNSYSDGVVMNFPAQATGTWTLKVTAGKSANWACAK